MSRILAVCEFPYNNPSPSDVSVNTWAFESNEASPTEGEMDAIGAGLFAFYSQLENYFSEGLGDEWRVTMYDIDDPEPRAPIREGESVSPVTPGGNPLPDEVAMCLSFHGLFVSGQPKGRRRGRVYLGPLSTAAVAEDGFGHARPSVGLTTALPDATAALYAEIDAASVLHSVWSRADDELYNVTTYFADNALDSQRRRGVDYTIRDVWDYAP